MTDEQIVELYWQRNESAIRETDVRYGKDLLGLAYRILEDAGESEETVSDTYWRVWECIPPNRPERLYAFLAKIARALAIDRYRRRKADKRAASEYTLSLDELSECIPGGERPDEALDAEELAWVIGTYLSAQKPIVRQTFVRRYFYASSLQEIAACQGVTVSWVKSTLYRARQGLRAHLEKEGYV